MKKALTKVILVAMMAIIPLSFYAQKKQNQPVEKYFYIFAEGGLSVNHTDLANYGFVPFYQDGNFVLNDGYVFNNFDGQLGLGYQFGKVMGLNAKFGTATLAGEKHGQDLTTFNAVNDPTVANKGFQDAMFDKTTFMEANLNLTFNLTNLFFGYNPRRVFNFIPHVGIGGIRYHAGAVTSTNEGAETPNIAAKEDAEMTFTVPVGAELNFNLARKLDFFIDYTFTWAGNDKLDQVQKLPDDIQVVNDMYSSVNAGLRFKFNKKAASIDDMCPACIEMSTVPEKLSEKDGKVDFDIVYEIPANFFEKEAVLCIVPTFTYNGGQIEFDPVNLVGEKVDGGTYQVNYKKGGKYTRHYSVNFKPETGMENGKVNVATLGYIYEGTIYNNHQDIMKNVYFSECCDKTIATGVTYVAPYVPPVDPTTTVTEYDTVKIYFTYNSFEWQEGKRVKDKDGIIRDFSKNPTSLDYAKDKLNNSKNVKEVKIYGWASPEGEYTLNHDLSGNRGTTVKDKLSYSNAKVEPKDRDWDGFFELVEKSSELNDKDKEILLGIKNTRGSDEKEAELQRRMATRPSLKKKLEKYIFPHQRRVDIIIIEEHIEKK